MFKQRINLGSAKLWLVGLFITLTALMLWRPAAAAGETVYILEIEGPVNQQMLDYFARGIRTAELAEAEAVMIVLDTPGGAVDATIEIIQLFESATLPVIVYVAPAGAQAASAGSVITLAAHASGMAPETVVGAASPVQGGGEDIPETLYRKAVEDLKAVMRNLADDRGEEVIELAEGMIEEATAVTASEALEVGFIDAIATDEVDLLNQLDGLTVVVGEESRPLQTADAARLPLPMTSVEGFLYQLASILMNPIFISALIGLGVQAIIFEFSNPGGWVAGFIGFICIGLALYGLGQLPTNIFGLALIMVAFILLLLELFTPTYGALAVTGIVTMVFGFLVLFNTPGNPEFARITIPGAISVGVLSALLMLGIISLGLSAQRAGIATGSEGLVGRVGRVRTPLAADNDSYTGTVFVYGALWTAESDEPLAKDQKVTVQEVEGLRIRVKKI